MSTHQRQSANGSGTIGRDPNVEGPSVSAGSPARPPVEPLPHAIGKYQVLERLGGGAMGVVYKCSQPGLDRPVAVKVLIAGRHASAEQILRFQREAWAAAQLPHPNVLRVYDVGSDGELHFLVMEYVDGWSLDRLIGRDGWDLEKSLRLAATVARALQTAHDQGIIHRDIKPSNILIHRTGEPKLADFGLAKAVGGGPNLSGSGDLIGTPRYMSPEQALAAPHEVDARTDIYSLGAVLYEMATGRPPVDGPNVLTILRRLSDEEPPPIRDVNPAVPAEVAAVCNRAMAKNKADRFASAREMAEALETCVARLSPKHPGATSSSNGMAAASATWITANPPRRYSRLRLVIAGAAGLLLVAAGIYPLLGRSAGFRPGPGSNDPEPGAVAPAQSEEDPAELEEPAPAPVHPAATLTAANIVELARQQLTRGSPSRPGGASPRERWKGLLETLTLAILTAPDNVELKFLRARARRQAGQYLAALEDLNQVHRREPKNLAAVAERLLANYELDILYLGNLNEPLLRPLRADRIKDDAQRLKKEGNPTQRFLADMVEALAKPDFAAAGSLAEAALGPGNRRLEETPDVFLLEADALSHLAESTYGAVQGTEEGPDKEVKRARHEHVRVLASTALRRGLDADPNHVGLLFLKADTFQRLALWGTGDNDDRQAMIRRQRPNFETALDRLRNVTPVGECDASIARTVLLTNFGRENQALEPLNDALSSHPTEPYLYTLKAWLRLQTPPDGIVTADEAERILREFQVGVDAPVEDYNSYLIRALLQTAAGRWDEAAAELRQCRRRLKMDALPTPDGSYNTWFARAGGLAPRLQDATLFLDSTLDMTWYLAVSEDLRIRFAEELLKRLADPNVLQQEKIKPEDAKSRTGWTHQRLARTYAAKNDKAGVLRHVGEALKLRLPDLKPNAFRDDGTFSGWNSDADFVQLYKQYEGS
jgi:predicted Ser/Thr protein kinase